MRKNYLLCAALFMSLTGFAQLNIQSGATFFIQPGATVTVQGDVTSNANIQGTGVLQLKGSASQNMNLNGNSVANLEIDNTNNVVLTGGAVVNNSLTFTNGKFLLGTNNLTMGSTATVSGADNTKYVVTNGTGQLIRNGLSTSAFQFPVGFDATTYNPLSIAQNGTTDNIGVRVLQKAQTTGSTGTPFVKEVVDASWVVTEATPGGSNMDFTAGWSATDELSGFNRTKGGISNYDGTAWDMTVAQTSAAAGTGPYTVTRSNITTTGVFAVGTRPVMTPLLVAPKVLLQGPYNTSTSLMNDGLRAAGLVPTTEPYTNLTNFVHAGSGGEETVPSSVFAASGTAGDDIVDWVFVSLHDAGTGAVVATRAALIDRDGDIVDYDGTNTKTPYVNMAGFAAGNYYVSVRHRNHLGARSTATIALSRTANTTYDFRTNLTQAFAGIVANNPMATLATNTYGLWGGNANSDGNTRRNGGATVNDYSIFLAYMGAAVNIPTVYAREDFNMDGSVRRNGGSTVNDYSIFLSFLNGAVNLVQPF